MQGWQGIRFATAGLIVLAHVQIQSASAAEIPLGHSASATRFKGNPPVGSQYSITIKAGRNGNPTALALPTAPGLNGGSVSVGRDGGALRDPLTAGGWSGLGSPPGSKGWNYKNKAAPVGGPVKLLSITPKKIKLVVKSTGMIPAPAAPNGNTQTVIVADEQSYCAEATSPYAKEVDGVLLQSRDQPAPGACPSCLIGADTDGDRIDDCYETGTGTFVDSSDTGTDPYDADSDGDGLNDGDETLGTLQGLDLPALGTSPVRKDLLIEYDWFDDTLECGSHTHRPSAASLSLVTAAFAAAPVTNLDGSTGIHLINDYGQGGVFAGGNFIDDADGVFSGNVNSFEFINYKAVNFEGNRNGYFHYVILPHRYDTDSYSSGYAEILGDDFIVSLYCANSDPNVANTIMHELGHNLGLLHGGSDGCNYKPNYNSVMNYLYQFSGIDNDCDPIPDGILSYSTGERLTLVESHLDENLGTCGTVPWDWNGNTTIESDVSVNLNSADSLEGITCQGTLSTLQDWDDWSRIRFTGISEADGAPVAARQSIACDNPAPM